MKREHLLQLAVLTISIIASLITFIGLVVIVGWYTHMSTLIQVSPGMTPMYFNTALCFILIGIGFLFLVKVLERWSIASGILIASIASLTLVEYIFGIQLFIDELFFKSFTSFHTVAAGRMSPNSAAGFLTTSMALILLSLNRINKYLSCFILLLGCGVFTLSSTALLGYFADLSNAYQWANLTPMAIHTTVLFILASINIILMIYVKHDSGEVNVSIALPIIAFMITISLTFILWKGALYDIDGKVLARLILVMGTLFGILLALTIRAHQKSKEQTLKLQVNQEKLAAKITEAHRYTQELQWFKEMADAFQACISLEEAMVPLKKYCSLLLPSTAGTLFLNDEESGVLRPFTWWGSNTASQMRPFSAYDCKAIKRKDTTYIDDPRYIPPCEGLSSFSRNQTTPSYLCLPLRTPEGVLGVLKLKDIRLSSQQDGIDQNRQLLADTLTKQLTISLASLKLRELLKNQAIRDPLTQLFNRRFLDETFMRELLDAQRYSRSIGVIMADIDHFKMWNDTYGHEAGDLILKKISEVLQKLSRKSDIACRFGGEEFVLVMPESSLVVTLKRAEQIRNAVSKISFTYKGKRINNVTISLGVSVFPEHGLSVQDLIVSADRALYNAKMLGRNRVSTTGSIAQKDLSLWKGDISQKHPNKKLPKTIPFRSIQKQKDKG